MPRRLPRKKRSCPRCERPMGQLGITTAGDRPVWGCPRCNAVVAMGKLKVPETPQWKDPHPNRRERDLDI